MDFSLPLYAYKISCESYYSTYIYKCKRIIHANFAHFFAIRTKKKATAR